MMMLFADILHQSDGVLDVYYYLRFVSRSKEWKPTAEEIAAEKALSMFFILLGCIPIWALKKLLFVYCSQSVNRHPAASCSLQMLSGQVYRCLGQSTKQCSFNNAGDFFDVAFS